MIDVIGKNNTVSLANMLKPRFTGSRVNLPLKGANAYIKFKHVSGVPSGNSDHGLSVFKLRVLDTLIDRLASLKNDKPQGVDVAGMDREALDALIDNLKTQLHHKTIQVEQTGYSAALGLGAQTNGQILNTFV